MYRIGKQAPRWLWLSLAWAGLGLGTAGAFLPVVPTTPFLLVSLWAGSKASPRMRFRLYRHPRYGAVLRAWHRHGAVPLRAKWLACLLMGLSFSLLWLSGTSENVLIGILVLFAAVALFILTRPSLAERPRKDSTWQPTP